MFTLLSLDPTNKKALEGMQRVEKATDGIEPGPEDDMEIAEESGEDLDYDASDAEVSWADNEVGIKKREEGRGSWWGVWGRTSRWDRTNQDLRMIWRLLKRVERT